MWRFIECEKQAARAKWKELQKWLGSAWIDQKLAVRYLVSDARREKKGLAIGIFTVFLVVMLMALLMNNVQRSPSNLLEDR